MRLLLSSMRYSKSLDVCLLFSLLLRFMVRMTGSIVYETEASGVHYNLNGRSLKRLRLLSQLASTLFIGFGKKMRLSSGNNYSKSMDTM